ncbi:hypothetical protein BD779DRAFT_209408 [Infundibulicybe gibba]|nr:hypothetical protein BD779DRAFT_209408 [Infundibulicybe gibba]
MCDAHPNTHRLHSQSEPSNAYLPDSRSSANPEASPSGCCAFPLSFTSPPFPASHAPIVPAPSAPISQLVPYTIQTPPRSGFTAHNQSGPSNDYHQIDSGFKESRESRRLHTTPGPLKGICYSSPTPDFAGGLQRTLWPNTTLPLGVEGAGDEGGDKRQDEL